MKITEVLVYILKKDLTTSMRISRGGFKVRRHCIIQVKTDEGLTGLGEGVGNPDAIKALIEKSIAPKIKGKPAENIEALRHLLMQDSVYFERGGSWTCAVSAIEMALWDIKGKALKVPLYELLGGCSHDSLELYASDAYWYEDAKDMGRDIEAILNRGIPNVKLHTGVLPPKEEHARLKTLSSVISSTGKFMIDLNCAYSLPDALSAVKLFEEFNPYWIEEPLAISSEDQLPRVRAASRVPIAHGENVMNIEGFRRLFSQNAIDVSMPDIARMGGILASLEAFNLAQSFGVKTSFHNFSSGVLLAATVHLMAARSEPGLLEFDSSQNSVLHEFFAEKLVIEKGRLKVPAGPGLGVELTKDVLKYVENP